MTKDEMAENYNLAKGPNNKRTIWHREPSGQWPKCLRHNWRGTISQEDQVVNG